MTAYIIISIIQAMGISLGVGSSTLAILNFFVAIKDGKIEPAERSLMGVNYIVLRVAMVLILLTTAYLFVTNLVNEVTISSYTYAQLTIIFVLFLNAILMTARIMPSSFGPAIQASSWYTLGFLLTLVPHSLTDFTYTAFLVSYLAFFAFVTLLIKFVMNVLKQRNQANQTNPNT